MSIKSGVLIEIFDVFHANIYGECLNTIKYK